jgi:serine/threonine protein kinase
VVIGDGLVSGRYRLGELLGTGGSASVFSAVDVRDDSALALKILHPHLSADEAAREALFREARAAAGLRHPNIVAVLDVGLHGAGSDAQAWIALELAHGVSLAEHVELHGVLGSLQTVALAGGVLRGLEAAHAAGLVHRDVSPANIMVSPGADALLTPDDVRLVDFGLADAAGRPALAGPAPEGAASAPGGALGSVNYVSPEQASGGSVDARGDIYQLGAVLYFALTGRPPFPRDSAAETVHAHLSAPPPVPSVAQPRIPRGVDRLVVKAMLKSRDDRFQSATEMLLAVDALRVGTAPVETRTLLLPSPRTASSERRPRLVATPLAVPVVPAAPEPVAETPDDGSWLWKSLVALVVVVAIVAWIVSSTTGTSPPQAVPEPSASATAAASQPPASAAPVAPAETSAIVPDIAGGSITAARLAIEAAGFVAGAIAEENSPAGAGTVLRSSPEQGSSQALGSVVGLVVASGLGVVPDVAGSSRDAAIAALQSAGFSVLMAVRDDATVPRGAILGTDPGVGTALLLGRDVTILVATTPVAAVPTPTPTPTATAAPSG